jgi:hypothetical protein
LKVGDTSEVQNFQSVFASLSHIDVAAYCGDAFDSDFGASYGKEKGLGIVDSSVYIE